MTCKIDWELLYPCVALKFDILGSGSTGNCGLIQTESSNILIDAGFSCKRTKQMLLSRNVTIESIDAIFITHEHSDHIQGLRGLRKYDNIKFFANHATSDAIDEKLKLKIPWNQFSTGKSFQFKDLNITSFSIPHDAADPIGYVFFSESTDDGTIKSIAWMTDLGYVPSHVERYVSNVDLLVIESNYDNDLLTTDKKRPPYIKARIRSRYGHLPNEAAVNFIKNNKVNRWKKVIFAHVSTDCNDESAIMRLLGNVSNLDFQIEIARP